MKIIRAKHYGFCFGVKRAYELVEKQLSLNGAVQVWGELIHNKPALEKLGEKGMKMIDSIDQIYGDVIIRSHGISNVTLEKIKKKANNVFNATCPYVTNVKIKALKYQKEGRQIIIIGNGKHPEMIGVTEDLDKPISIGSIKEAKRLGKYKSIGAVSQTTLRKSTFEEIIEVLKTKTDDLAYCSTICNATTERQDSISNLAQICDLIIVIGGKKSSNSKKLEEIALEYTDTKKIETIDEIEGNWFKGKKTVGLSAGASTPDWLIDDIENYIKSLAKL